MGRKVFLSFLGTTKYTKCNYGNVENCDFVQEALIKDKCLSWEKEDKIYIFLTKEAEKKNWKNGGNFNKGLYSRLKDLHIDPEIIPIKDVPEGKSETEIWEIFDIVFNVLKDNDEVFYDITHGFRSLPMLGMTLLNYAKFLKNIKVAGIYYGAFEARDKSEKAPIFDLTSFSTLQDWSVAADNFVNYGNAEKIKKLVENKTDIILRETKGQDDYAKKISKLAKYLYEFTLQINTVRGKLLVEGKTITKIKKLIAEIKNNQNTFKVFSPIISKIESKIENFKSDDINNGFRSVKWCLDHNLIQQGITLLQETIITLVLNRISKEYIPKIKETDIREIVSSAITIKTRKINYKDWRLNCKNNKEFVEKLFEFREFDQLSLLYDKLRNHRNNINHGGYLDDFKSELFKLNLEKSFNDLKLIIKNI